MFIQTVLREIFNPDFTKAIYNKFFLSNPYIKVYRLK